jgi:hypothetical protein
LVGTIFYLKPYLPSVSAIRRYGIVPGKPSESILVFRMESDDPGIRMPELGRQLKHQEGVALIKDWIREMK